MASIHSTYVRQNHSVSNIVCTGFAKVLVPVVMWHLDRKEKKA
jgi:hypothetical protein